jgi:hypothetical protein
MSLSASEIARRLELYTTGKLSDCTLRVGTDSDSTPFKVSLLFNKLLLITIIKKTCIFRTSSATSSL